MVGLWLWERVLSIWAQPGGRCETGAYMVPWMGAPREKTLLFAGGEE